MEKKPKNIEVNNLLINTICPMGIKLLDVNTIAIGENFNSYLGVIKYPSSVEFEWLTDVCNINNTIVTINCSKDNNVQNIIKDLSRTISNNRMIMNDGKSPPNEQIIAEKVVETSTKMIDEIANNNESMLEINFTICVYGESKSDLNLKIQNVKNKFIGRNFRVQPLQFEQLNAFYSNSPFNKISGSIGYQTNQLMPVGTLMGGFPFAFAGINDEKGLYMGKDNNGNIIMLDIWKRGDDRVNSNAVILGTTGTGKSTSLKHMVLNEYMSGVKIIIIDPQGEYSDMCKNLNGDLINVVGGSGGRINPLQIFNIEDEDESIKNISNNKMPPLAKHINKLEVFFKLYIDLTPIMLSILSTCLIETYKLKNITFETDINKLDENDYPIMNDLYLYVLEKAEEMDIFKAKTSSNEPNYFRELSYMLESIGQGADSYLFNGYSTVKTKKDFVVFNTKGINDYTANKQKALYHTVLGFAGDMLYKNPSEKVILICDECHFIVDKRVPESLSQLNKISKTARKYEGALWVATQQVIDLLNDNVKAEGQALLDQACIKLLMPTGQGKDIKELKSIYNLTEAEEEILSTIRRGRGLLSVGSRRIIDNLVLPSFQFDYMGNSGGR